ncbi:hypothetical protein HKX69_05735 [Streptomyces argyrophyllae]|uniref:Uncharacterized protein n=1 Tax=Streptomyces argyrophylli TaxID=2726118 RepID=A0A6M4PFR3_9ACTN|nr:hypothetical protein [Streptomyces argyrophyllae]QJS09083.1 hypothetical protein HKX69_05735 [Streptomyces argyrophyllae]
MKSKWKPGTRVRVRATVTDGTAGMRGIIERVNYAQVEEATSVLLDNPEGGFDAFGAYFRDDELEAE